MSGKPSKPHSHNLLGAVIAVAVGRCLGILKPFQHCSALYFLSSNVVIFFLDANEMNF